MATFTKYQCFVEDVAEKQHNLGADTFKVMLSNTAPDVATDRVASTDCAEISAGNGYTAGGNAATITSSAQASGTYKLVLADPATWTATGGTIGPFRYAILYNVTADLVVGAWDYGSSITLQTGETFVADFDPSTGILTLA